MFPGVFLIYLDLRLAVEFKTRIGKLAILLPFQIQIPEENEWIVLLPYGAMTYAIVKLTYGLKNVSFHILKDFSCKYT